MVTVIYVFCLLLYGAMMGHLTRCILGRACALRGCPPTWRGDLPGAGNVWAGDGPRAAVRPRPTRAAPATLARLLWRHRCENSCVLLFVAVFFALPAYRLVPGLVFSWFLLTLSWIDYHTLLLPDRLTLPFLLSGIVCGIACGMVCGALGPPPVRGYAMVSPHDSLLGAICGGGGLWLLNGVFGWVKGYAGLGGGDIKLLAGLGAWLGWRVLPLLCCCAALTGLAWWALQRRTEKEIPFGPCLALAGLMVYVGP